MKKHIIFGGFDYAVYWEMNQDAIYRGIDYFVDNDPNLIGTTYLGKTIHSPEKLLQENKDEIIILIGSIIYHTEIEFQLREMGFENETHFQWGISFAGDEVCPRLWHHIEWKDKEKNKDSLSEIENGEYALTRLQIVAKLIDYNRVSTIIDLCAANGRIKNFLPDTIKYVPVDYIKYSNETIVCDLNKYEFPESIAKPQETCMLLVEAIGYIHDWKWLLNKIASNCDSFICVHNDFARVSREYRRTHYNRNSAIFNHQIILEAQKAGFKLVEAYDYRLRTVILKFEKKKGMEGNFCYQ